jgi:plasmid stabilization system protein ParE
VKRRIVVEQAAEEDLVETAMYILQNQPAAATRFISAARVSHGGRDIERLLEGDDEEGEEHDGESHPQPSG